MPVYEYQCQKCSRVTEAIRRMSQADEPIACEHCGHKKTQRVHSVFSPTGGTSASGGHCELGAAKAGGQRGGCCGGCCHGHH